MQKHRPWIGRRKRKTRKRRDWKKRNPGPAYEGWEERLEKQEQKRKPETGSPAPYSPDTDYDSPI